MGELLIDVLLDTAKDSLKLIPFLLVTYLLMETLEHKAGAKARERIKSAGVVGPVWGGILGVMPQCGFSVAASSLFSGGVITVGTLIAIFLSTSDEMLPVFLSESVAIGTILKILGVKVLIAIISGLLVEFIYTKVMRQQEKEMDIHVVCEEEHCNCNDGIVVSAIKHTIQIFIYIFIISLVLNFVIGVIGEDNLAKVFSGIPVLGEMISALIGLIPNCASSVVIAELYIKNIIGAGAMMAGLLCNAGVGMLVLFRLNRKYRQNFGIIAVMYVLSVVWGTVIELTGIVF